MKLEHNVNLQAFNTFGIAENAEKMLRVSLYSNFLEAINSGEKRLSIIGGGSNIVLTKPVEGLVLKNELKGIEIVSEDEAFVFVKAAGGEGWHSFVLHCIEKGWGGIENLSLIPGCVGAAPMQNIGAYGVEIKDLFVELEAWHLENGKKRIFKKEECNFGYRESVFKRELKNQFFIASVTFKLKKKEYELQTKYGVIEEELKRLGVSNPTIKDISNAVINIRNSKLPNPKEIGNAGSFFKNPIVSKQVADELVAKFKNAPNYPASDKETKLAAGWLIEQCAWKGKKYKNTGVHSKQALVLVNNGNATGEEVFELSEEIIQSVKDKFGVVLEREVNIW